MPEKLVQQEFSELFVKILLPAFLTVTIGIAVDMKNRKSKISFINVLLSFIIGVAGPYLMSGLISEIWSGGKFTVAICISALLTEKIVKFIMNELNVDLFLKAFFEYFYLKIKTIFK